MKLSHIHETAWSQGEDSPKPESHDITKRPAVQKISSTGRRSYVIGGGDAEIK